MNLNARCEQILIETASSRPGWKYVKSTKSLTRALSKDAFVGVYTGFAPKVDLVTFQFSVDAGHKVMGAAFERAYKVKSPGCWTIFYAKENWTPEEIGGGTLVIYDGHRRYDGFVNGDNKSYVHINDFSERLNLVFEAAIETIERIFDTSSAQALFQGIAESPIGLFRPDEVLLVNLALGRPEFYEKIVDFYNQPIETVRSHTTYPFNRFKADQAMAAYLAGDFPRFSWA